MFGHSVEVTFSFRRTLEIAQSNPRITRIRAAFIKLRRQLLLRVTYPGAA
jgi:hypothetical protein